MSPFNAAPCPSCGATQSRPQLSASHPAEGMDFSTLQQHWHGFFKENVFFTYARCLNCGLLYCPQYFSAPQLDSLYSQMPDNTAGMPVAALKKTQSGYFSLMKKQLESVQGGLLEVGPDIGLFTQDCVASGRFDRYWMFEPNLGVHEELKKKLEGKRYEIHAGMLDLNAVPDKSVGCAAMIHVLDHVLNPKEILVGLKAKLSEKSVVALVTHDESSLLAQLLKKGWPAYCLQHPHLFRPASMRRLFAEAGYSVVAVKKTYNHFPVTYLARHLAFALGIKNPPIPAINSIQIGLKLGNMLTLAVPNP